MVTIGIDAHKRSHTVVATDEQGRQLAAGRSARHRPTTSSLSPGRPRFTERRWAVEDCRHLSAPPRA